MYHDKKGMALIGVIMAALIFSSLCGALLLMVEQDNLMAHDEETALKALYAAESGIRAVVVQLQDNSNVTFQDVEEVCKKISGRAVGDAVIDSINQKGREMVKISSRLNRQKRAKCIYFMP